MVVHRRRQDGGHGHLLELSVSCTPPAVSRASVTGGTGRAFSALDALRLVSSRRALTPLLLPRRVSCFPADDPNHDPVVEKKGALDVRAAAPHRASLMMLAQLLTVACLLVLLRIATPMQIRAISAAASASGATASSVARLRHQPAKLCREDDDDACGALRTSDAAGAQNSKLSSTCSPQPM